MQKIWAPLIAGGSSPFSERTRRRLLRESRAMFFHAYDSYMALGYPLDGLRPQSCVGDNSQGGAALTLFDALDSLVLLGAPEAFRDAVNRVLSDFKVCATPATARQCAHHAATAQDFDIDARVHVFEMTIRTLGGLLSAHSLILQSPELVPGYSGGLLTLAEDLTRRLLPAFDTATGLPLSWVNLKHGAGGAVQCSFRTDDAVV